MLRFNEVEDELEVGVNLLLFPFRKEFVITLRLSKGKTGSGPDLYVTSKQHPITEFLNTPPIKGREKLTDKYESHYITSWSFTLQIRGLNIIISNITQSISSLLMSFFQEYRLKSLCPTIVLQINVLSYNL